MTAMGADAAATAGPTKHVAGSPLSEQREAAGASRAGISTAQRVTNKAPSTRAAQQPLPPSQPALAAKAPQPPPPAQPSPPSAAPHIKTHHHCTTPDGWRLHLVHTRAVAPPPPPPSPPHAATSSSTSATASAAAAAGASAAAADAPPPPRRYPVVLCPGLGSSGAYTFDLSPVVSLADYLASRGWDVWTVELRGNGQSDRPRLFVRSRWWTVDDYVTKDLPAVLSYVRRISGAARAHVVGHSMGGMILTRLLALGGEPAAAVASATVVGSGCFLQGSWWQVLEHTLWLARFLWLVPAGATLRAYSPLALGRAGLAAVDQLYFWPPNTDPVLARAVLARNFSAISSGVILQFGTAFGPKGLRTADGREAYADAGRLAAVKTPVMFVCGDRDRMCPPQGAAATCALFTGSRAARYVELGPRSATRPTRHHYGHFDILMGRHAEAEVFPLLTAWLEEHDVDVGGGGAAAAGIAGKAADAASEAAPSAAATVPIAVDATSRWYGGPAPPSAAAPVLLPAPPVVPSASSDGGGGGGGGSGQGRALAGVHAVLVPLQEQPALALVAAAVPGEGNAGIADVVAPGSGGGGAAGSGDGIYMGPARGMEHEHWQQWRQGLEQQAGAHQHAYAPWSQLPFVLPRSRL